MPKVIVAGSRKGFTKDFVHEVLFELMTDVPDLELVSGGAKGVDSFGEEWAYLANVEIKRFPANWKLHKKRAGMMRNVEMSRYADELVAFWDGESKGTEHMIKVMSDLKKPVTVVAVDYEIIDDTDDEGDE